MSGSEPQPAFLNVERSFKGRRWVARLKDQRLAEAIAQKNDLPEILGARDGGAWRGH